MKQLSWSLLMVVSVSVALSGCQGTSTESSLVAMGNGRSEARTPEDVGGVGITTQIRPEGGTHWFTAQSICAEEPDVTVDAIEPVKTSGEGEVRIFLRPFDVTEQDPTGTEDKAPRGLVPAHDVTLTTICGDGSDEETEVIVRMTPAGPGAFGIDGLRVSWSAGSSSGELIEDAGFAMCGDDPGVLTGWYAESCSAEQ